MILMVFASGYFSFGSILQAFLAVEGV